MRAKRAFDGILVPLPIIGLFAPMWFVPLLGLLALPSLYASLRSGLRGWRAAGREWLVLALMLSPFLLLFLAGPEGTEVIVKVIAGTVFLVGCCVAGKACQPWVASYGWGRVLLLIAAVLWPFTTMLWSLEPAESFIGALRFWLLMLIGFWAFRASHDTPAFSDTGVRWMAGIAAMAGAVLLLEFLPEGGLIHAISGNYERFMEKTINRGLCAMAVLLWPIAGALWARHGRAAAGLAALPVAVAIMGMESASAQLALLGGGGMLLASYYTPALARVGMRLIPVILLLLPAAIWALADVPSLNAYQETLTAFAARRPLIWEQMIHLLGDRVGLGFGMDTSPLFPFSRAALDVMYLETSPLHPHCVPLQWLMELGMVGLLLGCALAGWVLLRMERACAHDMRLLSVARATAVAYVLAGLFAFGAWQHWWLALGWIAAIVVRRLHAA
jgi:hypothetical protein